jgi:uncharacterized membrane protein
VKVGFAGHGALRYVWVRPAGICARFHKKGAAVQGGWERLTAAYLLAAIGAAGLTYVIDLAFDTDLLSVLWQAALAAFACVAIAAVWIATSDDRPRRGGW